MEYEAELKEKDASTCALRQQVADKDRELVGLQKLKAQVEVNAVDRVAELEGELEAARATADGLQDSLGEAVLNVDKVSAAVTY
jgi:hypothetical protein